MSQYFHDFADGISGWTERTLSSGHTAPVWSVVSTDQLQATSTANRNEMLAWDSIDSDADRDDVEVLVQVFVSSTTRRWIAARVVGSGACDGYTAALSSSSIELLKLTAGAFVSVTSASVSLTVDSWVNLRFRLNSTSAYLRAWDDGDAEPGTWDINGASASDYTTAGYVGPEKSNDTTTQLWRYFGVGTNGDTAPASAGGGSSTDLIIADATHGHAADGATLTTDSTLAVNDATHAHSAEQPTLSTSDSTLLTVADALHGHAADAVVITTDSTLAIADATHAHAAEAPTLSTSDAATLIVADAVHAHAADSMEMSVSSALAIDDVLHAHLAEQITLTAEVLLSISDALHAHRADAVALSIPGAFPDVLSAFHTYRVPGGAGSLTFRVPGQAGALTYRVE